jgi:hypothetical protein
MPYEDRLAHGNYREHFVATLHSCRTLTLKTGGAASSLILRCISFIS